LKIIIKIFVISILSIGVSNADEIKWTNCKITELPFLYKMMKPAYKLLLKKDLIYEDFLKTENDKIEFIERTFDLENKKLTYRGKKKDEDINENISYFELVNENTAKILGKPYEMKSPVPNIVKSGDIEIKLSDDTRYFAVRVFTYNFEDNTLTIHLYTSREKDLFEVQKCDSDFHVASGDSYSSGTAFFISKKGYLLTNNHVVKGCKVSKINYFNEEYDTKLIASDNTLDLALLKANVRPKSFISFSKDEPKKRQTITAAGYPLGKYLSDDLKINDGRISALKGFENNSNEIQHDIPINPGNSGGPIVNEKGQLVAIAVSGMAKDVTEGLNFGIKASAAANFLKSNKISPSLKYINFSINDDKLVELLEESTVYTFCN